MLHKYFLCFLFIIFYKLILSFILDLQAHIGISGAHKIKQLIGILADEGLDVMAGDVVPLDAIVVEVVQNGKAALVIALGSLAVIRLRLVVAARVRPVAGVALRCGSNLAARAGPEPAVLIGRLQIGPIAASEIALSARCPDVTHIATRDALLHKVILLGRLQRDGIHAVPPANVARIQPVHLQAACRRMLPAEEV